MTTKSIFFIVAISFVLVYCHADTVINNWYGYHSYAITDGKNCTQFGLMCENCTDVMFCTPLPNGEFNKEHFTTCPDGTSCMNGECSVEDNDECNLEVVEYVFVCHQPGIFPDPYDCKKYHICIFDEENGLKEESYAINCPEGYGYDVSRGVCRILLEDDKCTRPVGRCTGPSLGPIPGNPSMFYICLQGVINDKPVYIPQLYYCEKNYEFYNNACRNPTPTGVVDGKCTAVGKFYDKDDCRKYKECTTIGSAPSSKTCAVNNKFNPKTENCELFPCN